MTIGNRCKMMFSETVLYTLGYNRLGELYDTRCYFNVRSKADISQLNLPHYANAPSQAEAALERSSQDACDVIRLTRSKAAVWTVDYVARFKIRNSYLFLPSVVYDSDG